MIWIAYNLLFLVAFVLRAPYEGYRLVRRGGYRARFGERLGRYAAHTRERLRAPCDIWLHAVSVGEVQIAEHFVRGLLERRPSLRIVLSTTTTTGRALADRVMPDAVTVIYYPLDFPFFVSSALRTIRPRLYALIERELWPNMLRALAKRKVPTVVVNARISPRSYSRYKRWPAVARELYGKMSIIFAQSEIEAERLRDLGARPDAVRTIGSVKYDVALAQRADDTAPLDWLRAAGVSDAALVITGGSTWSGEEDALLSAYASLTGQAERVLVLAPRHVERADGIEALIKASGLSCARRSSLSAAESSPEAVEVILLDTTGELRALYGVTDIAFVGKSLTQHGGHNVIEPGAEGCAVITGPHMETFPQVMAEFREADAVSVVETPAALAVELRRLVDEPAARTALGERGRALVSAKRGAIAQTCDALLERLPAS